MKVSYLTLTFASTAWLLSTICELMKRKQKNKFKNTIIMKKQTKMRSKVRMRKVKKLNRMSRKRNPKFLIKKIFLNSKS